MVQDLWFQIRLSWPISMYNNRICLEELLKTTKVSAITDNDMVKT